MGTDERFDLAVAAHDAQCIATSLQNIHVFPAVDGDGAGIDKRAFGGRSSIFRNAFCADAGDGANDTGLQVDAAEPAVSL